MDTQTLESDTAATPASASDVEAVPTVVAKKTAEVPPDDPGLGLRDENAAEIARLSAWATGSGGDPILAD